MIPSLTSSIPTSSIPTTTTTTMFDENTDTTTTTRSSSPGLLQIDNNDLVIPNYDSLVYNFVESRQYKAALALNNIGVSLLEGGAYRDALTTFQFTFELIREITNTITTSSSSKRLSDTDTDDDDESNTTGEDEHCFVYDRPEILDRINTQFTIAQQQLRACRRRQRRLKKKQKKSKSSSKSMSPTKSVDCSSILSPSSPSLLSTTTYCDDEHNHDNDNDDHYYYYFDVTILQDDNYKELFDAADTYPIQNTGYAIRIDTTCEFFTSNFVLQSSTIIMNYAIAYRCLINIPNSSSSSSSSNSKTTNNNNNNHLCSNAQREIKYIQYSYKLFTIAFRLLQQESIEFHAAMYIDNDNNNNILYEPHPQSSVVEQANWIIHERIELIMILSVQALMHMSFDLNLPIEGYEYYSLLGDLHIGHIKCGVSSSLKTKETILQILAPAA